MKIYYNLLLIMLLFSMASITAQEQSCPFDQRMSKYLENHPEEVIRQQAFEKKIREEIALRGRTFSRNAKAGPYIIPVVFHIYDANYSDNPRTGESRTITDERVKQSLANINADFKGFNDAVDNSFSTIEGGMNIEFRLAQIDPNGNTTTGIIYHERKEGFGLQTNDEEIAKYAWDNYKYFNVHIQEVVNSGSDTDSGIAWFPLKSMSDAGTARVVYNGKYLIYEPPASSLTHEFGHFLNLHHTFNAGCVSGDDKGDGVADTPPCTSGQATGAGNTCNTGVTNCFGQLINYQNHMDYNPCESMFTKGQVARMEASLQHEARITLWQDSNLIATGTQQADLGPRVIFTFQRSDDTAVDQALAFIEGFDNNNGSILNKKRLKAVSGAKFAVTGQMQEGVHFTATGVPSGLTPRITVEDNENAYITFTGNATNHSEADSKEISITLLNPAIVGGVGSLFSQTGKYNVNFIDPYTPYYEMYSPAITAGRSTHDYVSAIGSEFNSLVIGGQFRTRVRNYNGNTIGLDNNSMDFELLCNPGTINVKSLTEGTVISATTSGEWIGKQVAHLSPPVVTGPNYTAWNGRTGYAAIRIPTITGGHVYGWLRIRVSSNGEYAELTTFGLNPDPGKSIQAKVAVPNLVYSSDRFLESEKNDGTIGNEITVDVKDANLSVSGNLVVGTHYTVTNVPDGLNFKATVTNSRQIKLSMTGIAKNSNWAQFPNGYVKNIRVKFKDEIFANGAGSQVEFKEFPLNVEYIGGAFSQEVSPVNRYNTGSTPTNGGWVVVMPASYSLSNINQGYMFQDYNAEINDFPGDKLISFGRDVVANANYEVTPLSAGTVIGPNSTWQSAREFNEERGQHMIHSKTFTTWSGRTAYVGIRMQRSGKMHYGWFRLRVGTGGRTCEILEYGIQGIPNASIKAGSIDSDDVQTYCTAKGTHGTEGITKVEFAGIDNSSSRDETGYTDYTGHTAFVAQGKSYPLKVNVVGWNGGSAAKIHAWFDWNNDYDFSDQNEAVVVTKTSNGVGEITVNVPSNAKLGVTRMRLRVDDNNSNLPCGTANTRGEVEDYQVKIGISNASCNDGEQNGDETDIDCGGTSCEICPTCDDGIKNGNEDKIDCGGACAPCQVFTEICAAQTDDTNNTLNITNVSFGSINNTSTTHNPYNDFTAQSTNLQKGQSTTLTITLNAQWDPNHVMAWIDWYNDKDFLNPEDVILKKSGAVAYTATVTPPADAVVNTNLRLRVRSGYTFAPDPCGTNNGIGEVEDYTVTVGGTAPVDTQAPSAPTNLVASNVAQTTLSLSWTASTDNVGVTGYDVYIGSTRLTTVTGTTYNATGLTAGTAYSFSVKATDAVGNESTNTSLDVTTANASDTEVPSAPSNLEATNIAETTLSLNWLVSIDNIGVVGYDVYQGTTRLTTVTGTSYNVTGLTAGTAYTFSVKAKDAAGNESASSNTVNVTTAGGITPIYCDMKGNNNADDYITNVNFAGINNTTTKATDGYQDNTSGTTASVSRGASHNLKVTFTGWQGGANNEVYAWIDWNIDGDFTDAGEKFEITTKTTDAIRELSIAVPSTATEGTTRMRIVLGYNAADGNSPCVNIAYGEVEDYNIVVGDGDISDTQAPSAPTSLTASSVTQTTLHLRWIASTDNIGVVGYDIYQGATRLATVTGTTYDVSGLTASTAYAFSVKAKDAAGNESTFSNTVNVTTQQASDTQAPSAPTNLTASSVEPTTLILNWNASTDNVGVTGYDVYQGTTHLTTVTGTSYNVTGLTANTTYAFSVIAKDALGNESVSSNTVNVTTTSTTIPAPTYCSADGNAGPEGITNVTFAGINNSSVRNASGYDDFTSISATVNAGTSHNLRVDIIGYQGGASDEVYAFFDWNRDGDFADADESLELAKTSNLVGEVSVTVPQNATAGDIRMRLLVSYYPLEKNPCDTGTNDVRYGEYEDYTINITAAKSLSVETSFFTIVRNPVVNDVIVKWSSEVSGSAIVQLYNSSGTRVLDRTIQNIGEGTTTNLDVSSLANGLYLLNINNNGRTGIARVIVRR
ncbi:GEVED domain-containing protein [Aquimarina sp. 2201CG1-2-11]|uniref:GEVED domain-containing protein n=1 Tax=Aquimarina discodermiae TaxID=3231043 RepID=UPI003462AAD8